MKYIFAISRILLGLIFVVFGLNGFLHFVPTPPYSGVAGQFMGAIFTSHFFVIVFLTQFVGGLLLLVNRYVPLGLLLLGPVLVNILSFHIFMAPKEISPAIFATALWFIVFFQVRSAFSGVLVQKVSHHAAGSAGSPATTSGNRAA
ncbi:MAG TPA: hypothetical protein VKV05_12125 [Terriglobales bacterium]|nr:hypothetical protein [Terriglobales bacterium]